MAQNSQPFLLITLAFFGALLFSGASATTTSHNGDPVIEVGTWDAEKHYLDELGEWAVRAHNLKLAPHHHDHPDHHLTFQKVISWQHLPGLEHRLTIVAADHGISHTYEAVVCHKPLIQFKKLISFKLA
ncbi:putative cystatin domain-containing protein [Tanacetum coccineum]